MKNKLVLVTILLYSFETYVATCLLESKTMIGEEEGDLFSNKEEILALGVDKW